MVATRSPRARRVVATALGTGAGALALSPLAHADTLTDTLAETIDGATAAIGDAAGAVTNNTAPAPLPSPVESLSTFAQQTFGVVPSNLLRTDSAGTTGQFEQPVTQTPALDQGVVTQAIDNYNAKVEVAQELAAPIQQIAQGFIDTHDGRLDDNTIAQAFGAAQVPTAETINAITNDINTLADRALSGAVFADMQQAFDETLNTADFTPNLAGYIEPALEIARDVAGALAAVPRDVLRAAIESSPALLIEPIAAAAGTLIGAPLGALPGAAVGALLGALAPHNIIPGILAAIPSSIIGGLATGALGAIGATLATLPLFGILPLAGAATGSALALAALAATVFGLYIASFIPATIVALGIGAFAGVAIFAVLMAAAGLNPAYLLLAANGGFLGFLLLTAVSIGAYALISIWVPLAIFGLLAPLFVTGGALSGLMAGLSLAALAAATLIPLITALSALPGALAGGLFGFLAGTSVSSWISALIGANLGALAGAVVGQFLGRQIGRLVGIPAALGAFAALTALNFGNRTGDRIADPNGPYAGIKRAMDEMWRNSVLGRFLGALEYNFFHNTVTGNAYGDLATRINNLFKQIAFLDGRRLREMLLRGGLLGAVLGAIPGAIIGHEVGQRLGFFSPLNLINGLIAGLIAAIPGALAGAALGSLLSDLLAPLVGIPAAALSFLPWLGVLFTAWAIPALLTTLAALASTIIPAIAAAVAATLIVGIIGSAPLWLPFTAIATVLTIVQALSFNPALAATLGPIVAAAGLTGPFLVGFSVVAQFVIILTSLALAAVFVGIPTFLIVAALFTFPALAVPFAWALALPNILPLALGLSLLTGLAAGSAADALSKLITIPLGALIGGLLKGIPAAVLGTLIAAITRALTYGAVGTGVGAGIGASLGFPAGVIAALITHTRVGAGVDRAEAPTAWLDARIVNQGGFGDSLAFLPNLSGNKSATQLGGMTRVPTVATPRMGTGVTSNTANRRLVTSTALVGA